MIKNKSKIIATIGPSCNRPALLKKMLAAGVNAFRVNMSHGTIEDKREKIHTIKQLRMKNGERPCIIADLAGPKIRVKEIYPEFNSNVGQTVYISSGGQPDANTVIVTKNIRFSKIEEGAGIKINDGKIQLRVEEKISAVKLKCTTEIGGLIEKGKGVNFPGVTLKLPVLTEQDISDLQLIIEEEVDWIALSFVRSADDKKEIDTILKKAGKSIPVIAKIEKWEALQNSESIIRAFDAVMVARGDLGVETPPEQVPLAQKRLIHQANKMGKPVIIATQMLESMTNAPVPTRAEVSDIANAIYDGADALMVTGETAAGKYPLEVIQTLNKVITETEKVVVHDTRQLTAVRKHTADAISHATCQAAQDLSASCIITMTQRGGTAHMISRYRPKVPILALTPKPETCRRLAIVWGVTPETVPEYDNLDQVPDVVEKILRRENMFKRGNKYIITGGVPVGVPGTTNFLSVRKT